jgi:hypothetical protein
MDRDNLSYPFRRSAAGIQGSPDSRHVTPDNRGNIPSAGFHPFNHFNLCSFNHRVRGFHHGRKPPALDHPEGIIKYFRHISSSTKFFLLNPLIVSIFML